MKVTRLEHDTFDWTLGLGGADDVRRIAQAAAVADGRSALNEAAVLTLRNHGLDGGILFDRRSPDEPVGFAYLHGLPGAGLNSTGLNSAGLNSPGRPQLDLVVEPGARGQGVGTALVTSILEAVDGTPITAWSHGNHPAAAALAAKVGLESVRELWLMRRPGGQPLPEAPVPDGYTIRPFRAGQDDAGFLAVNAAAFAAHPEQGALDQRGLTERMAEDWFGAEGFLIGERDGRIVGFHWTKVHSAEGGSPAYGEVYVIGVDPSTQGSGLGRALLVAGLSHLRARGLEEVVLYVEGENTGAVRLYGSFGFTHAAADTDVMYA